MESARADRRGDLRVAPPGSEVGRPRGALAKNTVHRAIRRLNRAGLIEARQVRTAAGTFTNGHYVLRLIPLDAHQRGESPTPNTADDREPLTSTPSRIDPSDQLTLEIEVT